MARLRAGDPGDLWITAASQTAGRGRHGRQWASPPGNLYASFAVRLQIAPSQAPQLGFVAGTALAAVLRARVRADRRLRLKWPNDVTFDGAKLAGLLLESAVLKDRLAVVIGFGVNCVSHPDGLAYPATDLAAAGDGAPDPAEILHALAAELGRHLTTWDRGAGFETIREKWLGDAMDLGASLAVGLRDRRVAGTFEGIDANGRLLLATDNGRVAIEAGDVSIGGHANLATDDQARANANAFSQR